MPTGSGGWTYEAATRVAICEESGWNFQNGSYVGALGISRTNWESLCPDLSYYSVDGNIACASRIQSTPPDSQGCGAW